MRFALVQTTDEWGAFDATGYRLQYNTAYHAPTASPFTVCRIADHSIAMFVECPLTQELRTLVSTIERPPWLDAVGHVEIGASASSIVAVVLDAGVVDPLEIAFAAAVVVQTHGMLASTFANVVTLGSLRANVSFDYASDPRDEDDQGSWFGEIEVA